VALLLPLVVMGVQEGRLPEALEYGATVVGLAPDNAEARYWYGRALLRSGRPAEAKLQWETGLRAKVDHLGILEGLARLALAENETAKAYQLLSQLQRQGVQASWLDRLLAEIAAGKRLWAQSLIHLQDAMTLDGGGNAEDLLSASELSILTGDKPAAVAYCRQAVALAPGAATYGGLGEAFFTNQQVDSALVYLRRAVEQDPSRTRFRFNLANALEINGQVEEADFHFRTFLEQQPNDSVGRFNYAIHLEKMGRTAEALLEIDKAVDLDPGMLTARVVRIQLLEELGRWDDALAELGRLQELDQANRAELATWQERLTGERDRAAGQTHAGKVHLQHMVLGTPELVAQVQTELAAGQDFTSLVVRFSTGPAAARGGDVGWVDPTQMIEFMGTGIAKLGINEISPPMESKGLYHIFKRIP
jgi:tetratricopeptide (TPR) repeat protein